MKKQITTKKVIFVGLIVLGINFSFGSFGTSAQKLEDDDKCEGIVSKAAQIYQECFGGDIIVEFTPKQIHKFGIVNLEEEWSVLDAAISIQNNSSGSMIHI